MRTEQEMMSLILDFAAREERIRLVTLEGSRTNANILPDKLQDYDISYFVTDMDYYKGNESWLDTFGSRAMLQKPEDMELFPPELGNWFSYIILFEDGNKMDLTLIPVDEVDEYFAGGDGLIEVLLDKDNRADHKEPAHDRQHWIEPPTARKFDDCCNEFWMTSTYVVKGLVRREILFAIDHLQEIVRPNLLRMMAWRIGAEQGYTFSLGKNYKLLDRYLPKEDWDALMSTYEMSDYSKAWDALFTCQALFRIYSSKVAGYAGFKMPGYDEAVGKYTDFARSLRPL